MKICISAGGKDLTSAVDDRFGRCKYFLIVDTGKEDIRCMENQGAVSPGGAGIAAAQQVVDEGAEYVITGNVGPNAMKILSAGGIKVYRGSGMTVSDAVESLQEGLLEEIDVPGPSHRGMGQGRGNK